MNLYMLVHINDDPNNLDLIIQETSPERAVEVWREHWIAAGWIDETYFDGKVEGGCCKGRPSDALRIFHISTTQGVAGALGWNKNEPAGACVLVGHVNP